MRQETSVKEKTYKMNTTTNTSVNSTTDVHHNHPVPLLGHITVATLITVFNTTVILIYCSMRRKVNTISNYLMFAQALVDMLLAVVAWYETVIDVLDVDAGNVMNLLYAGVYAKYIL